LGYCQTALAVEKILWEEVEKAEFHEDREVVDDEGQRPDKYFLISSLKLFKAFNGPLDMTNCV
jgi:hypothetical protein